MIQNFKYKIAVLSVVILFVSLTFAIYFQDYTTVIFESDILNSTEVTDENEMVLNFICEYDGLNVIQILLSTNERINTSMLCVELIQNNKSIQKYNVKESLIADNQYLNLRLDNKIQSKNKEYYLKITSDAQLGNGVTPLKYKLEYSTLQHRDGYRPFLFIFLICVMVNFIIWYIVTSRSLPIERVFIILWCAFSLLYICSNTMYNVPDETHHFYRAYEISNGHMVSEMNEAGTVGGRDLPFVDTGFSPKYWQTFKDSLDARLSEKVMFRGFSNTALYAPVSYIPQAIGIFLMRLITDRIAFITYAGRCANWFCITLILFYAIKILPFGKEFLSLILLMPMNLHEAFSMAPDGMVVAVSTFLIAFVMHLRYIQKKRMTFLQIVLIYVLAIVISLYKIVYIPFCLIFLLIPKERFGGIKPMLIHAMIVACSVILVSIVWLQICNKFLTHVGANSSLQIVNILHHPIWYCTTIFRTYSILTLQLFHQMIGSTLGQLTIGTNTFMVIVYIYIMFDKLSFGYHSIMKKGNGYERWMFGIVIVTIIMLISTSIYVQWTGLGEKMISGLQGRYFIPLLLPLYFVMSNMDYGKIQGKEYLSFSVSTVLLVFNICCGISVLFYCLN